MKDSKYQILLLGENIELYHIVLSCLKKTLHDIFIQDNNYEFIDSTNFDANSLGVNPTVALYFTNTHSKSKDLDIISLLKKNAVVIIPIVDSFDNVGSLLPDCLREINAARVANKNDKNGITEVINHVLYNLGLLTKERNVFISYKRADCQKLANRLYEKFLHAGYTVFLDTESLSSGVIFQDMLKHRLADSFVLILLYSEHFFDADSKWTLDEYNTANKLNLGICSIVMPSVKVKRELSFSEIQYLKAEDFADDKLTDIREDKLNNMVLHIKSIYARLYASRKQSLVNAFTTTLYENNIPFIHQIDGMLQINSTKQKCIVFPLTGIPKSWDYYISYIKNKRNNGLPIYLLYDNQCILDEWLNHLVWLEKKTGISAINKNDIKSWIQSNL